MIEQRHQHALPNGYQFEGYRIVSVLGTGGFAITYKATEIVVNRNVAIKEFLPRDLATRHTDHISVGPIDPGDAEEFEWGLGRFRLEARTLVRFRHPNIVTMHRYFEANGTAYLVMEYEEGESLAGILKRDGTLTESELREILGPILDGLEEVHKTGFLHRDIKPDNLYIRLDGSPVLIDFGAARHAVGEKSKSLTSIITPGYAPLEQYASQGNQGPWTDIYSLGALLYRAVSGDKPPSAPDRVRDDPYVPVADLAKGPFKPAFLATIDWSLSLHDEKRPQSVAKFRRALDDLKAIPKPAKEQPRRRLVWAGAAALLIAVSGGAFFIANRGDNSELDSIAAERQRVAAERRIAVDDRKKAEAARAKAEEERKRVEESIRSDREARRKAAEEAQRKRQAADARKKAQAEAERRRKEIARRKALARRKAEVEGSGGGQIARRTPAPRAAARNIFAGKTAYLSRISRSQTATMRIRVSFRPGGGLDARCTAESPDGKMSPCVRMIGGAGSGLWSYGRGRLCLSAAVIGLDARSCYAISGRGGQYSAAGAGVFAGPFMLR